MDWPLGLLALLLAACAPVANVGTPAESLRFATIGGDRLGFVEKGDGEPLIFIHGGFQDYRMWRPLADRFTDRYRVIAYSRRNHFPNAASAAGVPDFAADEHASDLARLIAERRLGPAHIVGHSSGATAALFFAANNPELVRSLTIVEPPAASLLTAEAEDQRALQEFGPGIARALQALRAGDAAAGMRMFADAVGGPGTYDRRSPEQKAMMADNVAAHVADATTSRPRPNFTCEMAGSIGAPTLIVEGTRSPAFFRRIVDRLAACLPNARRTSVNSSHSVPAENPAGFARALDKFLRSEETRGRAAAR